ncbi:hypothetical protein GGF46_001276 [Coemansia sp. RSA 552]|nr:hypothetical protein GGF46_001276 [Coemansia sp. RSA 552]
MLAESPAAVVAGACVGGLVLASVAITLAVICWRRRRSSHQPTKAADEEATATSTTASVETQPLLSQSAIRTRYIDSPNEFARSFIDRSSGTEYATSPSQAGGIGPSPYNPAENTITVVATDSSDSSDSGIESSPARSVGGGHGLGLEAASQASTSYSSSSSSFSGSCVDDAAPLPPPMSPGHAVATHTDTPDKTAAPRASEAAATTNHPRRTADDKALYGRPRGSTLNVQAKEFVPSKQARAATLGPGAHAPAVAPDVDNGEQQATLPAADARSAQPGVTGALKRRCRFWPTCSNGNCKYVHPQHPCHMHPHCSFGNNCIYVHPGDIRKINAILAGKGGRRTKNRNEIIKFNNLGAYGPSTAEDKAA